MCRRLRESIGDGALVVEEHADVIARGAGSHTDHGLVSISSRAVEVDDLKVSSVFGVQVELPVAVSGTIHSDLLDGSLAGGVCG